MLQNVFPQKSSHQKKCAQNVVPKKKSKIRFFATKLYYDQKVVLEQKKYCVKKVVPKKVLAKIIAPKKVVPKKVVPKKTFDAVKSSHPHLKLLHPKK